MLYISLYDIVGNKVKKTWQLFSHRSHFAFLWNNCDRYGDNILLIKLTSALYYKKKVYSKEMKGLFFLAIKITGKF